MKKKKAKKRNRESVSSPLKNRRLAEGKINSPFSSMPSPMRWTSWKDNELPTVLWLCVLSTLPSRDEYLSLFRQIGHSANKAFGAHKEGTLHHSYLATLTPGQIAMLVKPIRENQEATRRVAALSLIECLPDRAVWSKFANEISVEERDAWGILAEAIAINLFHQSESATDVRWCKLFHMLMCGRLHMPIEMERQFREYPNRGDLRSVRPSIRAAEMSLREEGAFGKDNERTVPRFPIDEFWKELFHKTNCLPLPLSNEEIPDIDRKVALKELIQMRVSLMERFSELTIGSGLYARLDSAFGLVFYSIHLAAEAIAKRIDTTAHGRLGLRSVVEACITLSYLIKNDNEVLWQQYRSYGADRNALAFLKLLDADELPNYVEIDELEELANEDGWFEMRDIDVGHWAKLNLRKMAESSGSKDLYDRYYDDTSGFAHSQLSSVQQTVFTTCGNPLHRFHRVPYGARILKSTISDLFSIINR